MVGVSALDTRLDLTLPVPGLVENNNFLLFLFPWNVYVEFALISKGAENYRSSERNEMIYGIGLSAFQGISILCINRDYGQQIMWTRYHFCPKQKRQLFLITTCEISIQSNPILLWFEIRSQLWVIYNRLTKRLRLIRGTSAEQFT